MLPFLVATAPNDETLLKPRVVEATVFKEGLALVIRETDLPRGSGKYRLDTIPEALDGSLFYSAPPEAKVEEIRTRLDLSPEEKKERAVTIADYLRANVGRTLHLQTLRYPNTPEDLTATLTAYNPESGTAVFRQGDLLRQVSLSSILELDVKGLNEVNEFTQRPAKLELTFRATVGRPTKIRFYTLERGAAWTGSYLLDLKEEKAVLTGRAQLASGTLTMSGANVRLASGRPNLPSQPKIDLASGFGSLEAYLQGTQEAYRSYLPFPRDPYNLLPQLAQEQERDRLRFVSADAASYGRVFAGGGMGGGGRAYGNDGILNDRRDYQPPSANAVPDVQRIDDLFVLPFGTIDLQPGERVTRVLFSQGAKRENLLQWNQPLGSVRDPYGNPGSRPPNVVKSILRLTNESDRPWTDGPALVMRDGAPLAQTPLPFTPPGRTADLALGAVQDVTVSSEDREIDRKVIQDRYIPQVRLSFESTLTVHNDRNSPVRLELRPYFVGTALEVGEMTATRQSQANDPYNPLTTLVQTLDLKPNETRTLKFTYTRTDRG